MREIKYRGKSIGENKWVSGSLWRDTRDGTTHIWSEELKCWVKVDPATVGQFPNLHDKNGAEICEGDILALPANGKEVEFEFVGWEGLYPTYVRLYAVAYHAGECGFGLCFPHEALHDNPDICGLAGHDRMYIIGNIHDNPEILKTDTRSK
ncbi:YopX family protein [uncultured Alistipes sp.]|uniref:YopX family protein n=1 Tax=uncultured Alistipes sp. TaxID=538949 RepID=UPI0026196262|nr:YopX family protein [uncultured Alistipes sp.]